MASSYHPELGAVSRLPRCRVAEPERPPKMEWETSKENFQPLKQGRHPAKLIQEIAKAPAKAQACAEQERRFVLWLAAVSHSSESAVLQFWVI
jgi:hypothetical protein